MEKTVCVRKSNTRVPFSGFWGSITAPIDLRGVVGGILQTCEGTRFRTSGGNRSVSA